MNKDLKFFLNIQSLYARQVRGDLIETHKILHSFTGTHINHYFTLNTNTLAVFVTVLIFLLVVQVSLVCLHALFLFVCT